VRTTSHTRVGGREKGHGYGYGYDYAWVQRTKKEFPARAPSERVRPFVCGVCCVSG